MPEQLARFISFLSAATAAVSLAVNVASSTFTGAIAAHPLRQPGREAPPAKGAGQSPQPVPSPLAEKEHLPLVPAAPGLPGISQRCPLGLRIPGSIYRSRGCIKRLNGILLSYLKGGVAGGVAGERRKRRKSSVYRNSFSPRGDLHKVGLGNASSPQRLIAYTGPY